MPMTGICGVAFKDISRLAKQADVQCMLQFLAGGGPPHGEALASGPASMGVTKSNLHYKSGVAQMTRGGGQIVLVCVGNVYGVNGVSSGTAGSGDLAETLLRLYVENGTVFLEALRGEFAVAIWDGARGELLLATDRFRIHPLYYYTDNGTFLFASRIQSIVASPHCLTTTIEPQAILDVMAFSSIPTPKTVFREIHKVPPGSLLRYRNGSVTVVPYWEISFLHPSSEPEGVLANRLREVFREAVAVRLQSEEESAGVGTFLSGGIDSSTITGVVAEGMSSTLHSFSIGFRERRFDEISYARIAARHFGITHHEYVVTPDDTSDMIHVLSESYDEPFANASAVPTYYCAKLAKNHGVSVLYAGDGGDELFGGNERYGQQRVLELYGRIPQLLRRGFVTPLASLLAGATNLHRFVLAKKYIDRASIPYPERLYSYGFFAVIPPTELLEDGFAQVTIGRGYHPYSHFHHCYAEGKATEELDRQLHIDLDLAITDNDLLKVTRMTEAAGITVRFPFLDHRLAEFAATVPAHIKMRGTELRSFFKKAFTDFLPAEVLSKTKHGFGLPIPIWLRTDKKLNDMMMDLVLSPRSVQRGYFRRRMLETLVSRHKQDDTSFYGTALWNLMMLELWHRHHYDRKPPVE